MESLSFGIFGLRGFKWVLEEVFKGFKGVFWKDSEQLEQFFEVKNWNPPKRGTDNLQTGADTNSNS